MDINTFLSFSYVVVALVWGKSRLPGQAVLWVSELGVDGMREVPEGQRKVMEE